MTKQKAITILVEYAQKFREKPHNDFILYIEKDKEWNAWDLNQFIVQERNSKKARVVGNKSGKRKIRRK